MRKINWKGNDSYLSSDVFGVNDESEILHIHTIYSILPRGNLERFVILIQFDDVLALLRNIDLSGISEGK